jgi:hypothetical protein
MQGFALKTLLFVLVVSLSLVAAEAQTEQRSVGTKQLLAVRGEIIRITTQGKGMIAITIRPGKNFAEVTVIARENDLVGNAVSREGGSDLLDLLSDDDPREDEKITAAELHEGDVVSVIYDPELQNRALEIYLH